MLEEQVEFYKKLVKCPLACNRDKSVVTKCGHSFCRECIDLCLGSLGRAPCPQCREPVKRSDLISIPTHNNSRFSVDLDKCWRPSAKLTALMSDLTEDLATPLPEVDPLAVLPPNARAPPPSARWRGAALTASPPWTASTVPRAPSPPPVGEAQKPPCRKRRSPCRKRKPPCGKRSPTPRQRTIRPSSEAEDPAGKDAGSGWGAQTPMKSRWPKFRSSFDWKIDIR